MENRNKNGRTLIYNCVDKEYAHWIPLYCLGMLYHNKDIDIEIAMEGTLNDDEHEAVKYLQDRFPKSTIKINEDAFASEGNFALINGIKCRWGTARFITTPTIKNEYVYIGDVDVICMEKDIFHQHIEFMRKENMCYSNIVRPNVPKLMLSGLHFSIYDCYYPIPSLNGIDMMKNDEEILADLVRRSGIDLNYSTGWRPIHGIHFSRNRPSVGGSSKLPGWDADPYKYQWDEFTNTEEYLFIISKSNKYVNEMVDRINKYFFPERYPVTDCVFVDNETANWYHQTEYSFKNGEHTVVNTSTTNILAAFPHLFGGNEYSQDFDLPVCFEFDMIDINTNRFQIQVYPDSANFVDITSHVSNGSHVVIKVYSSGLEGFVDGDVTFVKIFPNVLDKCRIGLQLANGSITFSNFIVYPF